MGSIPYKLLGGITRAATDAYEIAPAFCNVL
jgi:hypothetical protein